MNQTRDCHGSATAKPGEGAGVEYEPIFEGCAAVLTTQVQCGGGRWDSVHYVSAKPQQNGSWREGLLRGAVYTGSGKSTREITKKDGADVSSNP